MNQFNKEIAQALLENTNLTEVFRNQLESTMNSLLESELTTLRMDKSKELIIETNLKNYEIAELVGYSDPHYFSFCFKKFYGESPNHYRKK